MEKVFGWMKQDRLRQIKLRGLRRVDWLFQLAAAAHNLLRMSKLISGGRRNAYWRQTATRKTLAAGVQAPRNGAGTTKSATFSPSCSVVPQSPIIKSVGFRQCLTNPSKHFCCKDIAVRREEAIFPRQMDDSSQA